MTSAYRDILPMPNLRRGVAPAHRPRPGYDALNPGQKPAAGLMEVGLGTPAADLPSLRTMKRKGLLADPWRSEWSSRRAKRYWSYNATPYCEQLPSCLYNDEFVLIEKIWVLRYHCDYNWDFLEHRLAGPVNRERYHRDRDYREDVWYWSPAEALMRTGLVAFRLMFWVCEPVLAILEWHRRRRIALIARLKIERMCRRIASRSAGLAALSALAGLLSALAVVLAPTADLDAEAEPPPLRPPRSPGVDAPGLFAPRC